MSYSGYGNFNSSEKYLDLNLYESDESTCKDVDRSTIQSCYYSKELKPKIQIYKFSGGYAYKANSKIEILNQDFEPTIGF